MPKTIHHILCAAMLSLILTGCALYPAVQVAGGAMTGYDAVILADKNLPRDHVNGGTICGNTDRMLERRLRERLDQSNPKRVSAHVIDRHAYLIGQFHDRTNADRAIATARSVQGLREITCKFFPASSLQQAESDTRLLKTLTRRFRDTKRLENIDLRVEVIQGNAILVGTAGDYSQKTAALAIASEVGGVRDVVDYINVVGDSQAETQGKRVATN